MSKAEVPQPRPGAGCKSQTSEEGMNFIKRHTLMDKAVPTVHQQPLFIKTSLGERLTVIAVDSAVASADGTHHDVIFVGTTRGRVLKLVNSARSSTDKEPLPVLIEALQVTIFSHTVYPRIKISFQWPFKAVFCPFYDLNVSIARWGQLDSISITKNVLKWLKMAIDIIFADIR